MTAAKIAIGAVIALATGAVVGVLFAPAKGSTTRNRLSKQGSRYAGAIKDGAGEYLDTLGEEFDAVRKTAVRITE